MVSSMLLSPLLRRGLDLPVLKWDSWQFLMTLATSCFPFLSLFTQIEDIDRDLWPLGLFSWEPVACCSLYHISPRIFTNMGSQRPVSQPVGFGRFTMRLCHKCHVLHFQAYARINLRTARMKIQKIYMPIWGYSYLQ